MVELSNVKVYELHESVVACRNAMRSAPAKIAGADELGTFYSDEEFEESLKRAKALAKSPSNSGHCNFLVGIRVAFDIVYPNYFSPELQRYHFLDIVTSSSKMHKLGALVEAGSFNKYVDQRLIAIVQEYATKFLQDDSYENRMGLLSNCPQGIKLFMRCNTNYLQLRTIYHQRKDHRLKEDWGAFCEMVEKLPYFEDFIAPAPKSLAELKEWAFMAYSQGGVDAGLFPDVEAEDGGLRDDFERWWNHNKPY